ncbi:hypothetical protein CSB37_02580 [bacterium DOLZORAL124_38_8]|nr:MAG: hypothetical protein CSB37_02580 [bacterium DOLZORAL124_38_8]
MKILQVLDLFKNKMVQLPLPEAENFSTYQLVLLKTEKEQVVGKVITFTRELSNPSLTEGYSFERVLTKEERQAWEQKMDESFARVITARELAEKNKLDMHFFESREDFESKVYSFFFVSPGNVDFRELLKDMAQTFKKRIHLQRVSPNDRLKMIGGYDLSGRENTDNFARFFKEKPTMDVVRDQGIMIRNNPKIYDFSGKIKGSLVYEVELYRELRKYMPHMKQRIKIGDRVGKVKGLDILQNRVKIEFDGGIIDYFDVADIEYENKKPLPPQRALEVRADLDFWGDVV